MAESPNLENRVDILEQEVARLRQNQVTDAEMTTFDLVVRERLDSIAGHAESRFNVLEMKIADLSVRVNHVDNLQGYILGIVRTASRRIDPR